MFCWNASGELESMFWRDVDDEDGRKEEDAKLRDGYNDPLMLVGKSYNVDWLEGSICCC